MSVTSRYREARKGLWREAPGEQGAVFWDAEPTLTVARQPALFEPYLSDPGLPLVDLGCGNGAQTRFLADRFPYVLGADLSAAALEHARAADPAGRAVYRQLDAAEKDEPQGLHGGFGDVNVCMRGVLHQCEADDRQPVVDGIATLVGERGRAFLVEPSEAAGLVLRDLVASPSGPPSKPVPVLRHGTAPGKVADDAVPEFLTTAGLTLQATGTLPLTTTEYAPDGTRMELPSAWYVAGRAA